MKFQFNFRPFVQLGIIGACALVATPLSATRSGPPVAACDVTGNYVGIGMSRTKNQNAGGYTLSATELSYTPGGDAIEITFTHPNSTIFTGINIVVTDAGTTDVVGTVSNPSAGARVNSCPGGTTRLTHATNFGNQDTASFMWTPPDDSVGDVVIKAFVLEGSTGDGSAGQEFFRLVENDGALVLTANEVDAGPPEEDAGQPEDDAGQPEDDAGQPEDDAGQNEPEDDAGQGEDDAGQPEDDAGQPEEDAGQPEDDAGQPEEDAGQPEEDAGQPEEDAGQGEPEEDAGQNEPEEDAGQGEPEDDAGTPGPGTDPEPETTAPGCACDAPTAPADALGLLSVLGGLLLIRRRRKRSN